MMLLVVMQRRKGLSSGSGGAAGVLLPEPVCPQWPKECRRIVAAASCMGLLLLCGSCVCACACRREASLNPV